MAVTPLPNKVLDPVQVKFTPFAPPPNSYIIVSKSVSSQMIWALVVGEETNANVGAVLTSIVPVAIAVSHEPGLVSILYSYLVVEEAELAAAALAAP